MKLAPRLSLGILLSICFVSWAAAGNANEKSFEQLKSTTRQTQMKVQSLLERLKSILGSTENSNPNGQKNILNANTVKDVTSAIKTNLNAFKAFSNALKKNAAANQSLAKEALKLLEDVFALQSNLNVITELQESITTFMSALDTENSPSQGMRAWLERNFTGTSISLKANIFEQVGLSVEVSHDVAMRAYRQAIKDPNSSQDTLKSWRQINYVIRQPISMLTYNLWFKDAKHFDAIFQKLPKKEIIEAVQYLNVAYRMEFHELQNSF